MKITAQAQIYGKVFSDAAGKIADEEIDRRLAGYQRIMATTIASRAPRSTGALRSSIVERGKSMQRSVAMDSRYGVAQEFGWVPRSAAIRAILGKRRARSKAMRAAKIPGKHFFYPVVNSMEAAIQTMLLGPIAAGIVGGLS